jgi:hypothetical protein
VAELEGFALVVDVHEYRQTDWPSLAVKGAVQQRLISVRLRTGQKGGSSSTLLVMILPIQLSSSSVTPLYMSVRSSCALICFAPASASMNLINACTSPVVFDLNRVLNAAPEILQPVVLSA